jgi:hypothetical protein
LGRPISIGRPNLQDPTSYPNPSITRPIEIGRPKKSSHPPMRRRYPSQGARKAPERKTGINRIGCSLLPPPREPSQRREGERLGRRPPPASCSRMHRSTHQQAPYSRDLGSGPRDLVDSDDRRPSPSQGARKAPERKTGINRIGCSLLPVRDSAAVLLPLAAAGCTAARISRRPTRETWAAIEGRVRARGRGKRPKERRGSTG